MNATNRMRGIANRTRTNLTALSEWTVHDYAMVVAMVFQGVVDTVITLPNFHLEGNPLWLALGPEALAVVKPLLAAGVLIVWFGTEIRNERYAHPFAWLLLILYAIVVGTNAAVLLA